MQGIKFLKNFKEVTKTTENKVLVGLKFRPSESVDNSFLREIYEAMFNRMLEIGFTADEIEPVFKQYNENNKERKENET